jgi:predicted RNA binding protein YcfA (HicA-like mRNA interferase family)
MASSDSLVRLLRNTPVRDLERALIRDGFALRREARGGGRIYAHPDGRTTAIHIHHGNQPLKRGTLGSFLASVGWTEDDLRRLRLLP